MLLRQKLAQGFKRYNKILYQAQWFFKLTNMIQKIICKYPTNNAKKKYQITLYL